MFREIYDSGEYEKMLQRECLYAYKVYCISEPVFMYDSKGLGLEKRQLRKSIIKKLKGLKNALLDINGVFVAFFHKFDKDIEVRLASFLYDLYNILILAVYLSEKYSLHNKKAKLDKQKWSDNLAMSILEGSTIGRYDEFKPYIGRDYGRQRGEIEWGITSVSLFRKDDLRIQADDFYYAQNTFLMHQLLMLVVLYEKSGTIPNLKYNRMGQKNITIDNQEEGKPDIFLDNFLDDEQWSSNLINIVTHFDSIMSSLKNSTKKHSRIKLANIFFRKDFIENFDMNELLQSYIMEEDLPDYKKPTMSNIADTIGRILDDRIQKYINRNKAWLHVVEFTKYFPERVAKQKNPHIDFHDGKLIYIFNDNKTFGITTKEHFYNNKAFELLQKYQPQKYQPMDNQDRENLTYKELQEKFKKPAKENIASLVMRKKMSAIEFDNFRNTGSTKNSEKSLRNKPVKKNPPTTLSHAKNYFIHTYIFCHPYIPFQDFTQKKHPKN